MTATPIPPAALTRRKLPIGIQTLREIREENYYYVDKTGLALEMVNTGKYYFLSRPRRFGKSLFLDTLKNLFEGQQDLFTGLAVETRWDWGKTYPVIRISFAEGVYKSAAALEQRIREILIEQQKRMGVTCQNASIAGIFSELIQGACAEFGQRVVVLVDEYDKPILDNITAPDIARDMRDGLRDLYSVIKGEDAHIKFAMLTGVSKFSKVSLFSGLNNLKDITLDSAYSALCGYTDDDVETVFAAELPGLDREQIRLWYNGYNWTGESVYNPFDLLLLFDSRVFRPYWFETGTPTFLVDLLTQRHIFTPDLSRIVASDSLLSTFDVDQITPEALLFQTGYLTIASVWRIPGRQEFTLKYPNLEVQVSLNDSLLQALSGNPDCPGLTSANCIVCCKPTISTASKPCSPLSSPASRTSGSPTAPLPSTKAITPACFTATLPRSGWISRWKRAVMPVGSTWRCGSIRTFTCSSSKWWKSPPKAAPCGRSKIEATPTLTKGSASRST